MPIFAIEASLPAFASHLRQEGRSAATVEKYRCEVRRFAFWLADRPLDREAVRTYQEALAAERTAAGVNGAAAALNRLFAFWAAGSAGCGPCGSSGRFSGTRAGS